MIVHSFDKFGEVADFNPTTGRLTPEISKPDGVGAVYDAVLGHYTFLADESVVLYRMLGVLTLRIGQTVVVLDDSVSVLHRRQNGHCAIRVSRQPDDVPVVYIEYPEPDTVVPLEDDPTPFVEAEDFDFGLFVSNVFNNPGRRASIYRGGN